MARAASASKGMDMEGFLDHGEGGGAKFLRVDFKKEDEYNVWLHPRSEIFCLWRVVWRSISDDGEKLRLWRWNSMEDPAILDKQRFKNDDGTYQHTPKVDPFMLLSEWINTQVVAGNIGWCDEIFKWEPSDADDVTIHAGGFTGMFMKRDLDKEQRQELRKAGVRQDLAFMENANAQEETVLCVIDNDNPGNGPQIATIKPGLANALRKKVKDRRKEFSKTPEKADPFKTPVCFSFVKEEHENGAPPTYSVTALSEEVAPLTDEIKAAFELDPPDTSKMQEQSNVAALRKNLEENWCHDITPPWAEIFKEAEAVVKGTDAAKLPDESTSFNHGANKKDEEDEPKSKSKEKPAPKKEEQAAPMTASEEDDEEESEVEADGESSDDEAGAICESCDGELPAELFKGDPSSIICPHCGAKYDHDKDTDEWVLRKKEEKPKMRASRRPKD